MSGAGDTDGIGCDVGGHYGSTAPTAVEAAIVSTVTPTATDDAGVTTKVDEAHEADAGPTGGCEPDPAPTRAYVPQPHSFFTFYPAFRPILLDIQMVATRNGYRIKELAYKSLPLHTPFGGYMGPSLDLSMHYTCFRHDPTNVPSHLTVEVGGAIHDRYTGLEIAGGAERYTDEHVVHQLKQYNLIVVKGHNKKKLLRLLFERHNHSVPEQPTIVNIDATTSDDDDREFCRRNNMTLAKFSFRFVYRRFAPYLALLFDHNEHWWTDREVYLNNAALCDARYGVVARGRSLWVCPHDHSCGRRWFTTQRCSAMNVGMLETLWFMMREREYTKLAKNEVRPEYVIRRRR